MKLFKYEDFIKYSHDRKWLYNAEEIFNTNGVKSLKISRDDNSSAIDVSANVLAQNKYYYIPYQCNLKIKDNIIEDFHCTCPVKESYNRICKHCLALLIKYNYYSFINNANEINLEEYYKLSLSINVNYQKISFFITYNGMNLKIEDIINQVIEKKEIVFNDSYTRERELLLLIQDKNLILTLEKNQKLFYDIYNISKYCNVNEDNKNNLLFLYDDIGEIIDYCIENDIAIFFERESYIEVSLYSEKYPFSHSSTKDISKTLKYLQANREVKLINKLDNEFDKINYLNLEFSLGRSKKHFFDTGYLNLQLVDLIHGKNNEYFLFYDHDFWSYLLVPIRKLEMIGKNSEAKMLTDFFDRKNINLNKFKDTKDLIDDVFFDFNWHLSKTDIDNLDLENKLPVLNIEMKLHEYENIPIVEMYYLYNKDLRVEIIDTNEFEERNFDFERKLLFNLKYINQIFDKNINAFVFKNQRHFDSSYKWIKKFKKDFSNFHFYNIEISDEIVYKEKSKKKYKVQVLNHGIDFIEVKWNIDLYSDIENKKIIEGYLKKQELVKVNNKTINLKDIDFDDLENKLNFLNSDMKKFAFDDQKMIINQRHFVTFSEFKNDDKFVNDFINKLANPNKISINIDKKIKSIIKPYQEYGIKWLINHYQLKTGAILADEMGLGKTIQTIGMLNYVHSLNKDFKTLIVVPAALVYNWQKELSMYSNDLKTIIIDGNKTTRNSLYKEIDNYQVIVISYHTLNIDKDVFIDKQFETIIIDEGHSIKNKDTQISKTIKEIKGNFKVILSGTPMENNASEIWSLFDFIMTGYMNTFKNFKKIFAINKSIKTDLLKNKMKYFILRRTKKDVLKDLPEKFEKPIYVEMNNEQKKYYANILVELKGLQEEIGEENWNKNYIVFLERLMRLRQICSNPKLVDKKAKENGSKFDMCISLIKTLLEENQKVLVFSQFSSMFEYFIEVFDDINIKYHLIDGSTNKKKRLEYVESFNNSKDINVFLISLKAGGVGLNLTSATNVIHYDFWWNMSAENQATDRAHRIGQTSDVNIYKIITKDSIEEKIVELQKYKEKLINTLLDYDNLDDKNLSIKDIFNILKL